MLVLKLRRTGKKHQPSYRLIASEKRSKVNSQSVENLGWYDPRSKKCEFNQERVLYWLSQGAQKTATVHNLLIRAGITTGEKIPVHKQSKKEKVEENINQKATNNMEEQTMQPGMGENATPMPEASPVMPEAPAPEMPAETPVEEAPVTEMPVETPVEEAPVMPEAPAEGTPATEEEPKF